jgi:structure-specific recognition protein 1
MGLDPRLESGEAERDPGEALVAMMEMASGVAKATRPKTSGSKGFAGVGGLGCVKANVKFNQGFLFCLPDGFAFVDRPALYLPFDELEDLQLARAEGVGSSFDLIVSRVPTSGGGDRAESRSQGDAFEFANISREELDGVRRYLAKTCSEGAGARVGGDGAEDDADDSARADSDDDDSDDEDFGVGVDANSDEEETSDDSDSDDDNEDDSDDSDADGDSRDEQEDFLQTKSADGAGLKRARDEISELRRGASSEPEPRLAADFSVSRGSEEEEEDDSDEDGAFEVVPVAKTARR